MRTEEMQPFTVDQDGVYLAVLHLLEGMGAREAREDVLVKKIVTPAGNSLYSLSD